MPTISREKAGLYRAFFVVLESCNRHRILDTNLLFDSPDGGFVNEARQVDEIDTADDDVLVLDIANIHSHLVAAIASVVADRAK